MNIADIIARKRDGNELNRQDLTALIEGYVSGVVPDYQMAAWAMAVYWRGMSVEETAMLTELMLQSGKTLRWTKPGLSHRGFFEAPAVDKHSTGGVGDKVSLVLAPALACCGLMTPMISGRGLGPTGGTLDKLESIPGFRANLTLDEIQQIAQQVGCVIAGASDDLAPADRKLYALRDVTATVASIGLITASILCKKLAENLDALVLDVKFGSGAFMKNRDQARELAQSMVGVGRKMGVAATAWLTDMNQPLGAMAGNAVEVNEAVQTLSGAGPADLRELVCALGGDLLLATGKAVAREDAAEKIRSVLDNGTALNKFHQMVEAQGGDLNADRPVAPAVEVAAPRSGFVAAIETQTLGRAIIELGGGRKILGDVIDHAVGLEMVVRLGQVVSAGKPLLRVFARPGDAEKVRSLIVKAFTIADEPITPPPLLAERISKK